MNIGSKRRARTFRLRIDVPLRSPWVEEVIDDIEKDELHVYHPDDTEAMANDCDPDGSICLEREATLPVSLKEWLAVACQFVRQEREASERARRSPKALAFYRQNGEEVLWPSETSSDPPPGPAALIAGVVICQRLLDTVEELLGDSPTVAEHRFKWVVAHELVHAFDAMRFIVPAFMDWRAFWKDFLDGGTLCTAMSLQLRFKGVFVDSYGTENELAMVSAYWPSQAEKWFDSWRSDPTAE